MDWLWANPGVMQVILIASTSVPFVLFASAGIWHFGGALKSGGRLVSVASLLGYAAIVYSIATRDGAPVWAALGVILQSLSVFLFGWCIGTSGKRNLSLAFSENCSPRLVTEGPYALVRHPFYTSYLVFWLAGIVVAPTIFTALAFVLLAAIYVYAARREDAVLAQRFQGEYPQWRKVTGAFLPKMR
jgi:protein-S-isoprenylcysteine O-methyltransferase Ste14